MMQLRTIGTGSKGNSYVLLSGRSALLVECGLPYRGCILPAIDYDRSKVVGCLISHRHKDHAGYLPNLLGDAVECYMPQELHEQYAKCIYAHIAEPSKPFAVCDFKVLPIECVHDCQCNGYIIGHHDMGLTLFVTDTGYIPADLSTFKFSHIMIEANYSEDIMGRKMQEDEDNVPHYKHVMRGHMSIEGVLDYLAKLDLSQCEDIVLLHLSNDNSNEADFVAQVQKAHPLIRVYAAKAGMELPFNRKPYL